MPAIKDKVETAAKKAKSTLKASEAKSKELSKKVADDVAATEIEVKKTGRAAARKAKAKSEEIAEKATEAAAVAEIEAKKAAGKVKRGAKAKADEAVEAAKTTGRKAKAAKLDIVIQSLMGGAITPEEIAEKVPKGAVSAYVKVEENKIYWVAKDGETGSVDIW